MQLERRVRIANRTGLHARPCQAIALLAQGYRSELEVSCHDRRADGKRVMDLMTLAAEEGAELVLRASGDDAPGLLDALETLVASRFGEAE